MFKKSQATTRWFFILFVLLAACGGNTNEGPQEVSEVDVRALDAATQDQNDVRQTDAFVDDTDAFVDDTDVPVALDADAPEVFGADVPAQDLTPLPQACEPLAPAPLMPALPELGELYYEQLGLGGFALGEAALIIGPNANATLIDVGNDSHADDLRDRFSALGVSSIEHVIITHFHADHGDGIEELISDTTVSGRIVHRGLFQITDAANDAMAAELGRVIQNNPSAALPLCSETDCPGLGQRLALGEGAQITFIGANATMAGERYETLIGPLHQNDSNGENARSVVGVLTFGAFQLLFAGDLTGGGSDTDDVESFFAARLGSVSDIDALGVDVLHAGHHGRNTSTNITWCDRLLPQDGRARNVIMGVSTAHLNSPHQEVLDNLDGRLADGGVWTTRVAIGGERSSDLIDAEGGRIIIKTRARGQEYIVQAIAKDGRVISSRAFHSLRACTPQ